MTFTKYITAAAGFFITIAAFLPLAKVEGISVSLWQLRELKPGPFYVVTSLGMLVLGLSALAIKTRMGRLIAGVIMFGSAMATLLTIAQFDARAPYVKHGAIGAHLMLAFGVLGALSGIAALIKPEPGVA